jgi:UDP-N-acetylmuramyl tripeptide synthase
MKEKRNGMTDFKKAAEYIGDIPRFAPKTGLDNTRIILEKLGSPERTYKVVHVAGTNGKGSVSKMISLMLEKHTDGTSLELKDVLFTREELANRANLLFPLITKKVLSRRSISTRIWTN